VAISTTFCAYGFVGPDIRPGRGDWLFDYFVTTAYSSGDPFPNRIDNSFTEPQTGYFQIENTGGTTFSGVVGTIAVSSFAGDLSFTSGSIILPPGASISIAIPDNSDDVGGFNGPY
jgi:hypothetical protein